MRPLDHVLVAAADLMAAAIDLDNFRDTDGDVAKTRRMVDVLTRLKELSAEVRALLDATA